MKKITYIFGAGASCGCLPIINQIPERLQSVIEFLSQPDLELDDSYFDASQNMTKADIQKMMLEDLRWLLENSGNHASVDTFAKKLVIRKDWQNLMRLKLALSIFFIIEQITNKPDIRYDSFYASILKDDLTDFPDYLRILTWNYDYQFEISFYDYSNDRRLESSQNLLRIVSKHSYDTAKPDKFAIYKLNGSTGTYSDRGFRHYQYIANPDYINSINKNQIHTLIRNYAVGRLLEGKISSSLSFAWEPERDEISVIKQAKEGIKGTEIIVVIGYSFPFFNREIDRKLISDIDTLEKVYIQAPDAENIAERFEAIRPDFDQKRINKIYNVDQFYIPNEM